MLVCSASPHQPGSSSQKDHVLQPECKLQDNIVHGGHLETLQEPLSPLLLLPQHQKLCLKPPNS